MSKRIGQFEIGRRVARIVIDRESQFPFRLARLVQIEQQVGEHDSCEREVGMRSDDVAQISFDLIEVGDRGEASFRKQRLCLEVAGPQLKRALKTLYCFFVEAE